MWEKVINPIAGTIANTVLNNEVEGNIIDYTNQYSLPATNYEEFAQNNYADAVYGQAESQRFNNIVGAIGSYTTGINEYSNIQSTPLIYYGEGNNTAVGYEMPSSYENNNMIYTNMNYYGNNY